MAEHSGLTASDKATYLITALNVLATHILYCGDLRRDYFGGRE
jgi:hypothetical protein